MIFTPRLCIQAPRPGDGKAINEAVLSNIENIAKWMPWANPPPDIKASEEYACLAAKEFADRKILAMLIWNRETGQLIGSTGFHGINWEIPSFVTGYRVGKEGERKGYITEALNALTRYAFEHLGARRLSLHCDKDNARSYAIPEKLGFQLEGTLRNYQLKVASKELRDTLVYSRIDLNNLPALDVQW